MKLPILRLKMAAVAGLTLDVLTSVIVLVLVLACGEPQALSEASMDFRVERKRTYVHLHLRSSLSPSVLDARLQAVQPELQAFFEELDPPATPEGMVTVERQVRRRWSRQLQLTAASLLVEPFGEDVPDSVKDTIRELPGTLGYRE